MTEGQRARPANMAQIVAINQGRAPLTMTLPAVPSLAPEEAMARLEAGHVLVDTREAPAFGAAHVPGALNVQLASAEFEQRVGWVAPPDAQFILLTERDEEVPAALRRLAFVGLDQRVQGAVFGGMAAWLAAGLPQAEIGQVGVRTLREALPAGHVQVLDVREPSEWDEGHIPGSSQMSFKTLGGRLAELGLDPDRPVVTTCASGMRSSTAASVLRRHGFRHVANLTGGMNAWHAAGLPVARDD